ncbi:MAG: CAP domain-containing protein [Bacteroidetes bacterium]|nr:T9SS type A sorting domain-containing protein [Bacteroidota bacterium]MCZ2132303.1 CAP domain-containing protein [Bacteroidota bacterium]
MKNISFPLLVSSAVATMLLSSVCVSAQHNFPSPDNPRGIKHTPVIELVDKSEHSKAPTLYSHGDPTNDEQYTLELINRARANPKEEGSRLMDTPDPEVQSAYSYFKINKAATKAAFAGYPERPPLAFNAKLIAAARTHSADMRDKNYQGHDGTDGSTFMQRINKAGYVSSGYSGENVSAYSKTLWYGHCGFNVDWGEQNQIELGHRSNIMNFENYVYKEIGVGIYYRTPSGNQTGPYIITHDFGTRMDNFLVGVVYKDNNNNNFYDPGEGLANIKITASKGEYYAMTSSSGGYAIPITGLSGSVTVTAEGVGLGQTLTKNVMLDGGNNVKADFTSALPGQVALKYPSDGVQIETRDLTLTWYKTPKAVAYSFDLATDAKFTEIVKTIASVKDTFVVQNGLKNGTQYYWRVKAQTPTGWGDYSPVNTFEVYIYPETPGQIYPEEGAVVTTKSITLSWSNILPKGEGFWLEVAKDYTFLSKDIIVSDSNLKDTTFTLSNLEYDQEYYWHVKAKNDAFWGDFSDDRQFIVLQLPAKPGLLAPADKYSTSNGTVKCTWKIGEVAADNFRFELSKTADMKQIMESDSTLIDTFYVCGAANKLVAGTYYWRVQSQNFAGWSEFSEIRQFTITPSGVSENENFIRSLSASVSPLPVSGAAAINFTLPAAGDISVTLLDVRGREIAELAHGFRADGKNIVSFDVSNLENGTYFCRIVTSHGTGTLQIVVER